jgi:hypothetical protein
MQLGIFLKIHAVIALLFAIGFIFMPATILAYYTTVPVNEVGSYMSQLFGSALITYAAILWLASGATESHARKAIVQGFFISMVVAVIITLHFQLTGPINSLGWSTVALYIFLAVMYGRFYFAEK